MTRVLAACLECGGSMMVVVEEVGSRAKVELFEDVEGA